METDRPTAREDLMRQAERLFGSRGVEAVSLRDIVRAAGHRNESAVQYHFEGWPTDWQRQMAVAFDAHPSEISQIGIGGPLPIAEVVGISIKESLRYFA